MTTVTIAIKRTYEPMDLCAYAYVMRIVPARLSINHHPIIYDDIYHCVHICIALRVYVVSCHGHVACHTFAETKAWTVSQHKVPVIRLIFGVGAVKTTL